ncbi:MAG: transglutaminase family protein [Prosthecobacter sp.]|nr:transglutaminase family protein [Prosthecobacter sp.]HBJ86078.1 cysteine protease [Verrucomicrobiales bacterium]
MTRHHILHRTVYRYREPVQFGLHRLVLRPREGHNVTVLRHVLTIVPKARLFWLSDLFGNNIAFAEITEPSDRLEINNDAVIERVNLDMAPERMSRSSVIELPVAYPQVELPVVQGYMAAVYPDEQTVVGEWLAALNGGQGNLTALEMVEHVGRSIYKLIRYRRREEPGVQSPLVTLSLGTGSCRDLAVLMIEACRFLGIAARFASGYLDTAASAAGRGAMHAWVDVYLPDSGWTGFDPTLGEAVSRKHIALGVSAHPRGVMPVSGIFTGPAGAYQGMEVTVTVREVEAG